MKDYILRRAVKLAEYIIESKATVRDASKVFGISKSTVHKDVTERLKNVDARLFARVKEILKINLDERHIRGGIATQKKFALKKQ